MNIVELTGGLGNQLYQYAFGEAQREAGAFVAYNRFWFEKNGEKRPYMLDKFQIPCIYFSDYKQHIIEDDGKYNPILMTLRDCNFRGLWQYFDYSKSILSVLQRTLQVKEQFYTEEYIKLRTQAENESITAVHVRRGDFIKQKCILVPLSYYNDAVELTEGDIFIFSDDLEWCARNFKFPRRNMIFVDLKDYLCFDLMRRCRYQIIANSTFSRFSAYLNDTQDKVIITPVVPSKDNAIHYHRINKLPEEWHRL